MRRDGELLGCGDSGPPEEADEREMSRWLDVLDATARLPFEHRAAARSAVLEQMPQTVRRAMVWSRWEYRAP